MAARNGKPCPALHPHGPVAEAPVSAATELADRLETFRLGYTPDGQRTLFQNPPVTEEDRMNAAIAVRRLAAVAEVIDTTELRRIIANTNDSHVRRVLVPIVTAMEASY